MNTPVRSCAIDKLINIAIATAQQSCMQYRHGAVLFSSRSTIACTSCNTSGNRINGYDVPSLHAEAQCLHHLRNLGRGRRRFGWNHKLCSSEERKRFETQTKVAQVQSDRSAHRQQQSADGFETVHHVHQHAARIPFTHQESIL